MSELLEKIKYLKKQKAWHTVCSVFYDRRHPHYYEHAFGAVKQAYISLLNELENIVMSGEKP